MYPIKLKQNRFQIIIQKIVEWMGILVIVGRFYQWSWGTYTKSNIRTWSVCHTDNFMEMSVDGKIRVSVQS